MAAKKGNVQGKLQQYLDKEGVQSILEVLLTYSDLVNFIHQIFCQELMSSLMKYQPKDPIIYMIQILHKKAESKGLIIPTEFKQEHETAAQNQRSASQMSMTPSLENKSRALSKQSNVMRNSMENRAMTPIVVNKDLTLLEVSTPTESLTTEEDLLKAEFPVLSDDAEPPKRVNSPPDQISARTETKKKSNFKFHTQQRHQELAKMMAEKNKNFHAEKKPLESDDEEENDVNLSLTGPEECVYEDMAIASQCSGKTPRGPLSASNASGLQEPRVNISFCANCAKMLFGNDAPPSESASMIDDTRLSVHSNKNELVVDEEDEEIESASQVSGPRPIVWNDKPSSVGKRPNSSRSHVSLTTPQPPSQQVRKSSQQSNKSQASRGWNIPTSPNESLLDFERRQQK